VYGAAVTTYSSRATFLGALAGADTWDFNGPEGNPVVILNSLGTNIVGVSTQGGDPSGAHGGVIIVREEGNGNVRPSQRVLDAGSAIAARA